MDLMIKEVVSMLDVAKKRWPAMPVILTLCLLIIAAGAPSQVHGQSRPFGAGVILGSPTGLSIKNWNSRRNAWDAGAAWSLSGADALHLHADILWHRFDLLDVDRTSLYYGIGARVLLRDDRSRLGARFPLGISHLFDQEPFEIFFELAPILDLVPDTDFSVDGGIGVRYYFKRSSAR